MGLFENRDLARDIQQYYALYDDLLDTNNVFRAFRNAGAVAGFEYGVSVFDERPAAEIIAIARRDERFAAYLRSQREWAILHAGLLAELKAETETLLAAVEAERARVS